MSWLLNLGVLGFAHDVILISKILKVIKPIKGYETNTDIDRKLVF
jgi:hypothetical protein